MSSKDPTKRSGGRFKFLSKASPKGSYDLILGSEETNKESLSKTDFTQCEIITDEVKRVECTKKVWRLKNISNMSNLEALASSSSCIFEFGEGVNKIQLHFYLKQELTDGGDKERHFSLWCGVLSGGEGKKLAFDVQVDKLSESLQFVKTVVTERAIIINSEADRKGTIVSSEFLPYFFRLIGGQSYDPEYRWKSVKELNFGFTVTQLQCSLEGRNQATSVVMMQLGIASAFLSWQAY